MTDCSNADIRDLLPDYVHDQLSVTDLARVEQHVASCADCAEELALLQTVLAIRPQYRSVNIADIVASLPTPGQFTTTTVPDNVRVAAVDGVRDIASARSVVRTSRTFGNWRAVAAVAVFALGAISVNMLRQRSIGGSIGPMADSSTVAELQMRGGPGAITSVRDSVSASATTHRIALSVGDPSDYTEQELKDLMAGLDKWDGSVSADPLPGVRILPPGF